MTLKKTFLTLLFLLISSSHAINLEQDKKFGVEVNPFYLLIITPGENSETMLSGTFSFFDHINGAEIAIPLHYMKMNSYKQLTIDIHYRKFLNNQVGGFYLSGFGRVARLEGETTNDTEFNYAKQTKVGLGAGLGFRVFSDFGLYWGASFSLGRYLTNDNENFGSNLFTINDDAPYILDIEFFKFGYSF